MDTNQEYMDPAALQAMEQATAAGLEGLDQTTMAQIQLQAIHAALQQAVGGDLTSDQAAAAALEHLQSSKPEDYYAHLAAVGAVMSGNVDNNGVTTQGLEGLGHDLDGLDHSQANGDKPLTSRFRGVCWNKKNRRWQAAINSSGKYIYLGSFVQEEEAARSFDRAAIRLRGNRAKLNYSLSDYVDEQGQLIDDPRLSAHLQNVLGKDNTKASKTAAASTAAAAATLGVDPAAGLSMAAAVGQQPVMYGQNLSQHVLKQGITSHHYPYNGAQKLTYGVVEVPDGCTLRAHIPGDEEAFAVLYEGGTIPAGSAGASVWDGSGAIDLGVFDTEKDARQSAGAVLKLAMFYKHVLVNTLNGGVNEQASAQQVSNAVAAVAQQYSMLLGAGSSAAADNDAAAFAAAVAAATGGVESSALQQPDQTHMLSQIAGWLQTLQSGSRPQDVAGAGDVGANGGDADALAGAEMMAAMAAAATGTLKQERDQEGLEGTMGYDGNEQALKRMRQDDGMAQMKQLSGFKLQDVMKSLFEPGQGS